MKNKLKKWYDIFSKEITTSEYSFCEKVVASPYSKWHIRELTDKGKFLGGGCDTKSLCGEKMGWDLNVRITNFHLVKNTCPKCKEVYEEGMKLVGQ